MIARLARPRYRVLLEIPRHRGLAGMGSCGHRIRAPPSGRAGEPVGAGAAVGSLAPADHPAGLRVERGLHPGIADQVADLVVLSLQQREQVHLSRLARSRDPDITQRPRTVGIVDHWQGSAAPSPTTATPTGAAI